MPPRLCHPSSWRALLAAALLAQGSLATLLAKTCIVDAQTPPRQPEVNLRLVMRDWQSQKLTTYLAAILLRDYMQITVDIVSNASWGSERDYEKLDSGEIDANLELWSAGKEQDFERFVLNGSAKYMGAHMVAGRDGMYVPRYMPDAIDFFSYRRLMREDAQQQFGDRPGALTQGDGAGDVSGLCGTPSWNCTDFIWRPPHCEGGHCDVQLLRGPTDYMQGKLEQQIRNHGLNISVVYTSMDTQRRRVWDAYARKAAVLFYDWEPREPCHGLSPKHFVHVSFPPKNDACTVCLAKQSSSTPNGCVDCDIGTSPWQKVVSQKVATEPDFSDVFQFIKNFQLSEDDYTWMFAQAQTAQGAGDPLYDAACMWVRQFRDRWQHWVKYTNVYRPFDSHECYQVFLVKSYMLAIAFPCIMAVCCHRCLACRSKKHWRSSSGDISSSDAEQSCVESSMQENDSRDTQSRNQDWKDYARPRSNFKFLQHRRSYDFRVLQHTRSYETFILKGREPPVCHTPLRRSIKTTSEVCHFVAGTIFGEVFAITFVLGLISTVWATASFMISDNRRLNAVVNPALAHLHQVWISFGENMARLSSSFAVAPMLFLAFFVDWGAKRWVSRVELAYAIWSHLEDIALLVGSAFRNLHAEEKAKHTSYLQRAEQGKDRFLDLYDFYRLLNALHYSTYYGKDPRVGEYPVHVLGDLVMVGLLNGREADKLLKTPSNMPCVICSWIEDSWENMQGDGLVGREHDERFKAILANLRAASSLQPDTDSPLLNFFPHILIWALFGFVVAMSPFLLPTSDCIQSETLSMTCLLLFSYAVVYRLSQRLAESPFTGRWDSISNDCMLCETELMLFQHLRSAFSPCQKSIDRLAGRGRRTVCPDVLERYHRPHLPYTWPSGTE